MANLVQVLNTAATYFRDGLYDESAELYEYALSTLNQQSERNAIDEAAVEQSLACLSMTRGNFSEAELKFQKAHALLSEYCAHNHPCRAVLLTNFAELHMLQGKFSIAESMLDSAWQILSQSNGDVLLEEKSATSSSLAECYLRLGKTDKAEEMLEASLANAESAGQPASIAISLNNLAHFQISSSNMSEAEHLLIRAMDLLPTKHKDYPAVLNNYSLILHYRGETAEAAKVLNRALDLVRTHNLNPHPILATLVSNSATWCVDQGNSAEIERLYRNALSIMYESVGLEHPDCATLMSNLALVLMGCNKFTAAEDLLKWACTILRDVGCSTVGAARDVLIAMAKLTYEQRQFAECELLCRAIIQDLETSNQTSDQRYIIILLHMSELYSAWGQVENETAVLDTIFDLLHKTEPTSYTAHSDAAFALEQRADHYFRSGQFQKAGAIYAAAKIILATKESDA